MFYVYALIDPREGEPFYIGKGKDERAKWHLHPKNLRLSEQKQPKKVERIREIQENGESVEIKKIHTGIDDEQKALRLEEKEIKRVGLNNLTNKLPGGWPECSKERNPNWRGGKTYCECGNRKQYDSSMCKECYNKKGCKGESNSFYGKQHSNETKKKIAEGRGSLTEDEVKEIRWLVENGNILQKEIAKQYSVPAPLITKVKKRYRYDWVSGKKKPENLQIEEREKIDGQAGENGSNAKLSTEEVREIKWLLENSDKTQSEIAKSYYIGRGSVSCISREKTWSHIDTLKKPRGYDR